MAPVKSAPTDQERVFLAAVIQLSCRSDVDRNWETSSRLIRRAAAYGCQLIATPENTHLAASPREKVDRAESLEGPVCQRYSSLARQLGIHLLLGSFSEKSDDPKHCYNTSVLFGPQGQILATYRKIHLFDVHLSEDLRFTESAAVKPGQQPVVAATPLARIGMSICYDLRFGELYRKLSEQGAHILAVPSAFTLTTGKDHWHPLLRARAIENQCYVLAPAQFGKHDDQGIRTSYGHSMIVDPWGQVVAMAPDGPGIALVEIDLNRIETVRQAMPVNQHRRL